jgi:ribosome-associated translation inhibitor RaiA
MGRLDFHFEYYGEIEDLDEELRAEAEQRLRALTEDRKDLVGASLTVEDIAGVEESFFYQARIVAYIKPENITVVEKDDSPERAVKQAIATMERRVRQERSKRRRPWQQPDEAASAAVYELSARELYDAYADQASPEDMIRRDRDNFAAELMLEEKLEQGAAYYAADQILEHAQEILNTEPR